MSTTIRVLVVGDPTPVEPAVLESANPNFDIVTETRVTDALARIKTDRIDCLVTAYDLPTLDGLTLLQRIRAESPTLPILFYDDSIPEDSLKEAFKAGLDAYISPELDTDDHELLAARIDHFARDRYSVVDRLERVLLECNRELGHARSREDAVSRVCQRLIQSDAYNAVWVGEFDSDTQHILPMESNAVDGLDDFSTELVDSEGAVPAQKDATEYPTVQAVQTKDIQTVSIDDTDHSEREDSPDHLFDTPAKYSEHITNGAIIPITHNNTSHGVLVVYTDREEAFGRREREILSELGTSIGHLFNFIDLSDRYTQLLEHMPIDALERDAENDVEEDGYFERVVEDITDQQQRLQELANAKSRFQALFDESPDMIFVHDSAGKIIDVNQRVSEKLGYDREEVIGMHAWEIDPTLDADRAKKIWGSLNSEDSPMFDGVFQRADDQTFPVEVHVTPLDDIENEFLSIGRDISNRLEREQELKRRSSELRRQNERLEEFVDVLSHDIPNHLNVAQTRLDIARHRNDTSQLDHVETAHDRIETIIDDMRSLVEHGREVEETDWHRLSEVAGPCWENCRGEWQSEDIEIAGDGELEANESRLKQLFENLFWNACDHGGEGVQVTVGLLEDGFFVEDDGPGIPEDERERVLEPGYSTDAEGHSGFGLTLVREIAAAHNWNMHVGSGSDGGARFEFTGIELRE